MNEDEEIRFFDPGLGWSWIVCYYKKQSEIKIQDFKK